MKKNYFKNLMQVSLLLGAAFVISSCDDVIGQEDNPVASYVQWKANTPEEVTLKIGNTYTVKATAVSSAIIVYESENPKIAKVDPVTGEITAVAVGETNINAVISGASSAGKSVFVPEKISIKVIVKDGKASLTRAVDEVIEFTANKDSIIDLSKLFTAYPKVGTGANESAISFTAYTYDYAGTTATPKKYVKNTTYGGELGAISGDKFTIGGNLGLAIDPKNFTDTLYVIGQITSTNGTEYTLPTGTTAADWDIVTDTVKIVINKSIAFFNEKGERDILTADKYKTPDFSKALEAGTYYVNSGTGFTGNIAIKGDVKLIFGGALHNTIITATSLSDQTDNAKLSIFGEAIDDPSTSDDGKYIVAAPVIRFSTAIGDAISNFAEINLYAGTLRATTSKENNGAIVKVKNLNVFGGTLIASNTASGYAISLLDGGKLTVKGGSVTATGKGSDTDRSYGVIGDVEVAKGTFQATSDYRAVKGSLTAGEGLEIVESNDPTATTPTWTKITGTTSNAKGIKSQAKK